MSGDTPSSATTPGPIGRDLRSACRLGPDEGPTRVATAPAARQFPAAFRRTYAPTVSPAGPRARLVAEPGAARSPARSTAPRAGGPRCPGRDPAGPLGDRTHLRPDRARPLLRPRLQRRPRPALPAGTVAAAGHRNGRRDPRTPRTQARYRHQTLQVSQGLGARAVPLSPSRRGHRAGLRGRHQRLHRAGQSGP